MKNFNKLVDAVNLLHEHVPIIVAEVLEQLAPNVGKPIFKADGSFRKSVNWEYKPIQKQLPNGDWLTVSYSIYKPNYAGCVDLRITVCLSGGSYEDKPSTAFTFYENATVTIYHLDQDGNLVDIVIDLTQYDQRYNANNLLTKAEELKTKTEQLRLSLDRFPYRFREALFIPTIR